MMASQEAASVYHYPTGNGLSITFEEIEKGQRVRREIDCVARGGDDDFPRTLSFDTKEQRAERLFGGYPAEQPASRPPTLSELVDFAAAAKAEETPLCDEIYGYVVKELEEGLRKLGAGVVNARETVIET